MGLTVPPPPAGAAHAVKDANGRAYNRTSYIEQRRAMMQTWANYLDKRPKPRTNYPLVHRNPLFGVGALSRFQRDVSGGTWLKYKELDIHAESQVAESSP